MGAASAAFSFPSPASAGAATANERRATQPTTTAITTVQSPPATPAVRTNSLFNMLAASLKAGANNSRHQPPAATAAAVTNAAQQTTAMRTPRSDAEAHKSAEKTRSPLLVAASGASKPSPSLKPLRRESLFPLLPTAPAEGNTNNSSSNSKPSASGVGDAPPAAAQKGNRLRATSVVSVATSAAVSEHQPHHARRRSTLIHRLDSFSHYSATLASR